MKRSKVAALLLGTLAAAALIILVAPRLSGLLAEAARRKIETRASEALGGTVSVARLRLGFLPPSMRLDDVRFEKKGNRGSSASGLAPKVFVRAGPLTFLGLRRGPFDVSVEGSRVRIVLAEGRPLAGEAATVSPLPPLLAALPAGSSLRVDDAEVEASWVNGPSLSLAGLRLESRPEPDASAIRGSVAFAGGALRGLAGTWEGLSGDASFTATAGGVSVEGLSLRAKGMALTGRVRFASGAPATAEGEVQVATEIGQLARFLPAETAPEGRLEARLSGSWRDGALKAQGSLSALALSLWGVRMDSLRCDLEVDQALHLQGIRAHLFGGEATGSATVSPGVPLRTDADVRFDGVDLAQVLAYAAWGGPPLRGTIHYRGQHRLVGGTIEGLSGSGVFDAVGHYVSPRGVDLPLEVTSNLEAAGDTVRLSGGTLRAGSVRGGFEGTVKRGDGIRLRLRGATGDISEVLPLFARPAPRKKPPLGPPAPPSKAAGAARPVRLVAWAAEPQPESALERLVRALGGTWEWNGDLHYGTGGLSFAGTLAGSGLTYRGADLGSLEATIVYRDEKLTIQSATFRLVESGELQFAGTILFAGEGALSLRAGATAIPIGSLLAVAGLPLPIEGRLNARFSLGGKPLAPAGRATIDSGPLRVAGVPFDGLKGEIVFTPDLVEARGLTLAQGSGALAFDGPIPYRREAELAPQDEGRPPRLAVKGSGLDLSLWSAPSGGVPLAGTAEVHGSIGGALDAPVGSVILEVNDARLARMSLGAVLLEAGLTGDAVTLRAGIPGRGIDVRGRVRLDGGRFATLEARFDHAGLRGEEILPGSPEDVFITLSGTLDASGPLGLWSGLQARADLSELLCRVAGVALAAEGPAEVVLADGRLRLSPVVLAGSGTRIEIGGEVGAGPEGRADFTAHGGFDLGLLRPFVRGLQATGRGEVQIAVSGQREHPALQGSLRVVAQAIRYPDLPFPVDALDGQVIFEGSRVRIGDLHFLAGGGPVGGSGEIDLDGEAASSGPFGIRRAEVRFKGNDVKADFPEGFRSVSDLDLTLAVENGEPALKGSIDLVKGIYARDFRIESSLVRKRGQGLFELAAPGPLARVRLALKVGASGEVWLRNDFGSIEGQGTLEVTGTAARPSVAGRITAVEGGTIRFRNVRYRVQSGAVDFSDPEAINPRFDLTADTTVSDYQITLRVEGTADDFRYELTSAPALPQQDIVSLLLTGHTLSSFGTAPGPEGQTLAEETATAYLTGRLSEELSQRLSTRAGLDVIAIDPMQVNGQGDPTARVTLGKQLTPDLYATYSNDLGSSSGSIYQLDYSLSRDLKLTSLRDRDGSIGGDIKYVLRGRPPVPPGFAGAGGAPAARPILEAIRLEGHLHFEERRVRRPLRLRTGRPLERAAVNDGVDRLLAFYRQHDYLMAEVDYDERPAGPGRVELVVTVASGPRIAIRFEGTRNQEGLRQKVAPYWQKGIFMDDIVDAARHRVESSLRDRGWLSAAVEARVQVNDEEAFRVLFSVRRGPRVHADAVRIEGARLIPGKKVRKAIDSARDGLFSRGIVRQGRLHDDATAIRALYLSRGFPQVAVPEPEVALDPSGRRASVVFHVDEGPRVILRDVRFEGARALPPDRLRKAAALDPGSPYTAEAVDAAATRLRKAYDETGYPDVRVQPRVEAPGGTAEKAAPAPRPEADAERHEDVVFALEEGAHQTVGPVEVSGNLITREDVIRKAVALEPGDALSRARMLASQTRLYQRGIFTSVSVAAEPRGEGGAPGASAGGPDAAPRLVRVAVQEAAPLTQVFGVGYDSEEKARGLYEISNRNIFGGGRYVGLQMRGSDLQQRASLLYREAGIVGGSYDALGSTFWEDERRPAFSVRTIGSSIQIGRQFSKASRTLYRYSLKDVGLSDASAVFEGTTLRLSSLSVSEVHDTRDAPFDPLRGHYVSGELQIFGSAIGSEADFTKFYAQIFRFREVLPKTVWAQALRLGVASTFGRSASDPTVSGDTASGVPPSERFFAGGDTTVRGFRRDRLGPVDATTGDPAGGEGLFLLNEELRFPIFRVLQGVIFYDAGNVYRTLDEYDPTDLRQVAGAGLRLATPIGPFRFEYGGILDRRADEPRGQFFISIGQAF